MNTKQVIVLRKDLNMRTGKMCAQSSHASMSFLSRYGGIFNDKTGSEFRSRVDDKNTAEIVHWLNNSFRKIVCYVESEAELVALHESAVNRGLVSHLIIDNGVTEFNGVPTKTCLAIGPHWDERFIGVTDSLPLL